MSSPRWSSHQLQATVDGRPPDAVVDYNRLRSRVCLTSNQGLNNAMNNSIHSVHLVFLRQVRDRFGRIGGATAGLSVSGGRASGAARRFAGAFHSGLPFGGKRIDQAGTELLRVDELLRRVDLDALHGGGSGGQAPRGADQVPGDAAPVFRGVRRRGRAGGRCRWVCEVPVPGRRGCRL
ncbi:dehydration-responsive element-binding protein 1I [Panicum miliaceum]|uniref:Dehydration-responsive element-binding protein 1I n=1 Tax=Panicum miliaceum TaxID=4540 RepID=A0A3L6RKJ3_PANMI|nr:dehydration-responsive element-binding protein 1I [Panicum miliaceum]